MKALLKHIPILFLFTFFTGAIFFVPAIFVDRFTTGPALWIQAGVGFGVLGFMLLANKRIHVPPKGFLLLMITWAIYHAWRNFGNIENIVAIITLIGVFFLFYAICPLLNDKKLLFVLFSSLALLLSLWGLGQLTGILRSYNGSFVMTGPFDNPAGISASLVVLLPFLLYGCSYLKRKYRLFAIIIACLVVSLIVMSKARTAVLATVIILIFFLIRLLKERNIKLSPIHYTAMSVGCLLLFTVLFFMKKDSANGRLLIWQCSGQLISRNPVLGYGGNGFTANYMNQQASYFSKHPDSKQVMLADNIRHPFNEFLKWTANYGILGLCLTLLLIVIPIWASWKNNSPELFFIRLSLLSIGICAFFSYPFNYPFIRIMTVALIAFMLANATGESIKVRNGYLVRGTAALLSLGVLGVTAYQGFHEREWHRIAHKSLRGQTVQMLPQYEMLHTHLRYKDLFLYNYAAELNVAGDYEKSLQIARECDVLWADYDLQMLMAENCLQLQQYNDTENYLKKAAAMCPVKFMPLYRLAKLYDLTGNKSYTEELAKIILNKRIKIHSPTIAAIQEEMRKLIERRKNDSATQSRTDIEPLTTQPGQNTVSEQSSPETFLPP